MNFRWALEQLNEGRKVKLGSFLDGIYLIKENDCISHYDKEGKRDFDYHFSLNQIESNAWELFCPGHEFVTGYFCTECGKQLSSDFMGQTCSCGKWAYAVDCFKENICKFCGIEKPKSKEPGTKSEESINLGDYAILDNSNVCGIFPFLKKDIGFFRQIETPHGLFRQLDNPKINLILDDNFEGEDSFFLALEFIQ